jgi:hypothetical protein
VNSCRNIAGKVQYGMRSIGYVACTGKREMRGGTSLDI